MGGVGNLPCTYGHKRLVKTPDELNGIKIRLWQQKVQIEMWNCLGARAIPLPWGEVYTSLTQGIVNGMPHNIVQVVEEKFFEQLDYCTLLDFNPNNTVLWINDKLYSNFPKDIQKAISESAWEAGNYFTEYGESLERDSRKTAEKKGTKFFDSDRGIWVQKAKGCHKKLESQEAWSKGLLKKLNLE